MTVLERSADTSACDFPSHWSPALRRIFAARGVTGSEQLNYSAQKLLPPDGLKGLPQAIARLQQALQNNEHIVIVGDFDADGATSTTLAYQSLKAMGFQKVDYLVPNRFDYGYGLTPEIVEVAAERFQPQLIITVDNGISSCDGVATAMTLDIDVIVTDHHLPGDQTPEACAIVNPNQRGCEFESKQLAGVGVIFYVMSALRKALREQGWFKSRGIAEPNMAQYLDLVALGTVADVVPLDYNNRILVHQGLQRIRAGVARPGIYALLQVARKAYDRIASIDLGFIVGPRLNAAGRLDDISRGIACLLAQSLPEALPIASELDELNHERRAIERSMQAQALELLGEIDCGDHLPWGLSLYEPDWHQGVIGILAGRLKERYHRPVIAFAEASDTEIKGSARSIEGLHIRDALDRLAKHYPHLLQKFGGHAMAAGLSLKKQDFAEFSKAFDETVREMLNEDALTQRWLTDGELSSDELTLEFAHQIKDSGPWGQHFPEPSFVGTFNVINHRIVGEKHLKLALSHPSRGIIDAIAFNVDSEWLERELSEITLVYQLDVNVYQGDESAQLIVRHIVEAA